MPGNNVEVPARCVTTPAEIPECDTVSNAGGYVISAVRTSGKVSGEDISAE